MPTLTHSYLLAEKYMKIPSLGDDPEPSPLELLKRMIHDFRIDGVIWTLPGRRAIPTILSHILCRNW